MKNLVEKIRKLFGRRNIIKLSPTAKDLLLGIAVGVAVVSLSSIGLFEKFENITLDSMFRLRGRTEVNKDIIIVGIDDKSLETLGRWPWTRDYHASFIKVLNMYGPKFIVFDILFPEHDPGGDGVMALVAKEKRNLYLASFFVLDKGSERVFDDTGLDILSLPHLRYEVKRDDKFLHASGITLPVKLLMDSAKGISIVNSPTDADGATRHLPLVIEYGRRLYPTLSLQLACDYLGVDISSVKVERGVITIPYERGDIRIPVDSRGRLVLNFSGPIHSFKCYSYVGLLHEYSKMTKGGQESVLRNLRDKIIFVGYTATGSVDLRIMPFSNSYPAVGIHTTALSNILDRNMICKASSALDYLIVVCVAALLGLLIKRARKVFFNLAVMSLLFLVYLILSLYLFAFLNFWISTFTPLLAILLTYMSISISHYEAVRYEKKIMENELLIARRIQQSFLPKSYPPISFLEFGAKCNPAKQVGGDLYDFVELGDEKFGIVIGDVSGKGVPAALYMARTISELRMISRMYKDAARMLKAVNDVFAKEVMEKSFITMQYLVADSKSKRLIFSNAGHNALLHFVEKENSIKDIDTQSGLPIGMVEGIDFEDIEISLAEGDILFFYTDGISEARDRRRREFGLGRVKEILLKNSKLKAEEIMSKVFDEIEKFSKGAPQHDDMTAIIIKAI